MEVLVVQDAIDRIERIDTLNVTHINVSSNDGKVMPSGKNRRKSSL